MTSTTLLFSGLIVFVICGTITIYNFLRIAKGMSKSIQRSNPQEGFKSMLEGVGVHVVFGALTSISGIVTMIGLIWYIVESL